jgi:hypothetical protein
MGPLASPLTRCALCSASAVSGAPKPTSAAAALSELALEEPESGSLGLFVLMGFVRGELAGDAVTGGGLGC